MSSANLPFLPVAPNDLSRQWKIDHAGRINKRTWIVSLGVLTGLAFFVAFVRLALRLKFRKKLLLDDVFVLAGVISLAVSIGVLTQYYETLFKTEALNTDPTVKFSYDEALPMLEAPKLFDTYLAFLWTSVYAIKFSFLVFFRTLIKNVSRKLDIYYWFIIVFCIISWVLAICMPFMLCPYFTAEGILAHCYPGSPYALNIGLAIMVACMDIFGDLMIISIPIIILRMTRLRMSQKFGIALFLCLSVAMIVVAIVRVSGMRYSSLRTTKDIDPAWSMYWTHMEGCIAVFMGSVTAFRGIFGDFLQERSRENTDVNTDSLIFRLRTWLGFSTTKHGTPQEWTSVDNKGQKRVMLPEQSLTKATLNEVRRYIGRHGREPGNTTMGSLGTIDSQMDYDPLNEYHVFQRQHTSKVNTGPIPQYQAPGSPNGTASLSKSSTSTKTSSTADMV